MKNSIQLSGMLDAADDSPRRLDIFAILTLGIIESLANGAMSSEDAVKAFFNASNCLYVRKKLANKTADKIMGHGVQLPDLFETLSEAEAQREFQRELGAIRALCLELVDQYRAAA